VRHLPAAGRSGTVAQHDGYGATRLGLAGDSGVGLPNAGSRGVGGTRYVVPMFATLCLALTLAQAGPGSGPADDVDLLVGVRRGLLRYDRELLTAKPGARARLSFTNVDDISHNWVLCRTGTNVDDVAAAAVALGEQSLRRQFVPELPAVLVATPLVEPGKTVQLEFEAPTVEGDYPYLCTLPGHAALMRGVLRISSSGVVITDLRHAYYEGVWLRLPDFSLLSPVRVGESPDGLLSLDVATRAHDYGLRFTGTIHAAQAGMYQFHLDSDDGARVWVGGKEVVERDGVHSVGEEATGSVELAAGAHALQVDYFQQQGDQELRLAWSSEKQPRIWLTRRDELEDAVRQELVVLDDAIVVRAFIADAPPRALAVGLPGGVSFCFDPEAGSIAFGWRGGFLDVGPDRAQRGGQRCLILGERFSVGDELGREGPTLLFEVDGRGVRQTVTATPDGALRSTFQIDGMARPVTYRCKREGLQLRGSDGVWQGDELRLRPTSTFRVEVCK
jgi:plastocyanin